MSNTFLYSDISKKAELIVHDGIIPGELSLAKKLLEDEEDFFGKKYFMGIPEGHNSGLHNSRPLVTKINEMLKTA